jgi:CPA1 family monovalent cation:H+ antiporter
MDSTFENGFLLLLIAAVVAMITRQLRMPYSVGLVIAGIVLSLLSFAPQITLTKGLLFNVLLPPLIFEAAFYLQWNELRRDLGVIVLLATAGVALSAAITTAGMHFLAGWPWTVAIVFGVLIAATDPVSVIATFKEAGARGRLLLLVESESLFNDGTAAVAFAVALEFALGDHAFTPGQMALQLLWSAAGGILVGAAIAAAMLLLAGRTKDHLVEITFTTIAAYGSFLVAEKLHASGVLATLTAGILLGNLGPLSAIGSKGREAVEAFWEYAAFVSNSFVFLLIGMREAHQDFRSAWRIVLLAITLVTIGRAAAVYPCCALFARSSGRVPARHQHVLFWGGLRGALALALALALPPRARLRHLPWARYFFTGWGASGPRPGLDAQWGAPQQPLAHVFCAGLQFGRRQAIGSQHVERRIDVAVLVVEVRSGDA